MARGDDVMSRVAKLEVHQTNHEYQMGRVASQFDKLNETLKETNTKLDNVCITLAEARGASRAARLIGHGIAVCMGFVGGMASLLFRH